MGHCPISIVSSWILKYESNISRFQPTSNFVSRQGMDQLGAASSHVKTLVCCGPWRRRSPDSCEAIVVTDHSPPCHYIPGDGATLGPLHRTQRRRVYSTVLHGFEVWGRHEILDLAISALLRLCCRLAVAGCAGLLPSQHICIS